MHLYLISASKNPDVTRPLLDRIAEALEFQLFAHVAPFWQCMGVSVRSLSSIEALPREAGASPIVIYDDVDQAMALGWHSYNPPDGQIFGTAFLSPILENGGTLTDGPHSLSVTLSHEALEAVIDPYVNFMAFCRIGDRTLAEPIEVCDRVQGDSYSIGGVSVSNFLGPRAFRDGPGPYDWLRRLHSPWEIAPRGYCMRYDLSSGDWLTTWGDQMPSWEKDLKLQKRNLSRIGHRVQSWSPSPAAEPSGT